MKNLCDVIKYGGFLISYAAAQRPFFSFTAKRKKSRSRSFYRSFGSTQKFKRFGFMTLK